MKWMLFSDSNLLTEIYFATHSTKNMVMHNLSI